MSAALQVLTASLQPLAVSIPEAARLLGLSPHTIRAYIREDKIQVVRFGRRIAINMSEIKRLASEGIPAHPETPSEEVTQ